MGGHVVLTAKGLDGLAESVVNASGVVQARTVRQDRGVIELIADPATGVARVEGRLDASAPEAAGSAARSACWATRSASSTARGWT
ncbi:hypothetical protein, partial [Mitsuaria sp. TWR114]|uniref:hypothetical protein n=1 Tax=Mitsuaria sp. TWR114 TaxID=2601731 RepID=UPI0021076DDD